LSMTTRPPFITQHPFTVSTDTAAIIYKAHCILQLCVPFAGIGAENGTTVF